MPKLSRLLIVAIAVAGVGCQGAVSQTVEPTQPTGAPTPQPTPKQTTTRGQATPSTIETPSPAATLATATPSRSLPATDPPREVWRQVDDFPPEDAYVAALAPPGDFIAAAGSIEAHDSHCSDRDIPAVWLGGSGDWSPVQLDEADNGHVSALVRPVGYRSEIFAVGGDGSSLCPGDGVAIWAPTDKSGWHRLPDLSGFGRGDSVSKAVAAGDHIVAIGWRGRDELDAIWLSDPDEDLPTTWRSAGDPPLLESLTGEGLSELAAIGDRLVGIRWFGHRPLWYSEDGGERWHEVPLESTDLLGLQAVTASQAKFVAVGSVCCTFPGMALGAALSSDDGARWATRSPELLPAPLDGVVAVPGGFVAIGRETYLSKDGVTWRRGPALPAGSLSSRVLLTTSEDTILAVTDEGAWTASVGQLWAAQSDEPLPEAERPAVGSEFGYDLLTHCGPEAATIRFDLRSWVPDPASLVDGSFPDGFDDPEDPGTLLFVAGDELEFRASTGDVIRYFPTDSPPDPFPCA